LSPLRIRYSEDGRFANRGVTENDGLDLAGIDILASGNDHVFRTIQYVEIAIRVLITDVSGAKESVPEYGCCVLRIVPISWHHVCAAGYQFTGLTGRCSFPGLVGDLHLDARARTPARHEPFIGVFL